MRDALLALSLLAVLAVPAEAAAAVVALDYEEPIPGIEPRPAYTLTVRAGVEADLLTVSNERSAYTVRDAAGGLQARSGCELVGSGEVRCPATAQGASHSVFVDAGRGVDYVGAAMLLPGTLVELRGGGGGDYIAGNDGNDLLLGGRGNDHIGGNAGDDTLEGGGGDDMIDGGADQDVVSYDARRASVTVDLRAGTGGTRGERDRLAGIEEVVGGRAADALRGAAGPNTLRGGPGDARDRLSGRAGDDVLVGYRARGGPGDDSIDARIASCGRGRDRLTRVAFSPEGPFDHDCEAIVAGAFLELAPDPVRLTSAVAVYRLRCVAAIGRCKGTLELSDDRGLLGRAEFSRPDAKAAEPMRLTIPLTRPAAGRAGTVRVLAKPAYRRDRFKTRLWAR